MKLFLKIMLGIIAAIAFLVFTAWAWIAIATRSGPEAPPLASLSADDFQSTLDAVRAERRLVGMVGRVDVGGETIALGASGLRQKDGDEAILTTDLFHVGSIGKSMSATVIATLIEDGTLYWASTLGETLPDLAMDDGWRDVRLWQLLTHRASIPRVPLRDMLAGTDETQSLGAQRRSVAEILLAAPPETPVGSLSFAYSNEGYMLASLMAETVTGTPWETLVQERFADPLGLETLGFGPPPPGNTWGHRRLGSVKIAFSPKGNADNPQWMSAAGTLHLSLDDLVTYARAHLDAGKAETSLLSPETFARLHRAEQSDYAAGWVVQKVDLGAGEETVIWHNGSNTMWYALLMLLPERDASIILATNDGSGLSKTRAKFDALAKDIATMVVADHTD